MAGRPLRPATDQRLGRPLPHQPANRTQAPPSASPERPFPDQPYQSASVCGITPRFRGLPPTNGQVPHVFLTRPPRFAPKSATFDLHALGTPPALILSQDQTLHQNCLPAQPKLRQDFVSHCACVVHDAPVSPAPRKNPARPTRRSSIFGRPLGTAHALTISIASPDQLPATNLSMCHASATG